MTNQLFSTPPRAFDRNGEPLAGAKAYTYLTGTMTAVTVTDAGGTPLAWPVIADLNGTFPQMFYAGTAELKLIVTDAADAIQPGYPIDPVALAQTGTVDASGIVFSPTAEAPSLDVQGALEDLSALAGGFLTRTISVAGLATGGGTLAANRTITVTKATSAEALAGTSNTVAMTPIRTKDAIDAAVATIPVIFTKSYGSTAQTITTGGLLTLPHAMGIPPKIIVSSLTCVTGEAGYSAGDTVAVTLNASTSGGTRFNTAYFDATNVYVRFSDAAACFALGNKGTGVAATLTNANWTLTVRAFA